jgi:hypothetical protein
MKCLVSSSFIEDNIIIPVKSKVEIKTTEQGYSSIIIIFTNALNEEINLNHKVIQCQQHYFRGELTPIDVN